MSGAFSAYEDVPLHGGQRPDLGHVIPWACQAPERPAAGAQVAYDWRCRGCVIGAMAEVIHHGAADMPSVAHAGGRSPYQQRFGAGLEAALAEHAQHGYGPQGHPPRITYDLGV